LLKSQSRFGDLSESTSQQPVAADEDCQREEGAKGKYNGGIARRDKRKLR
jgi:hypothetical protein